MPPTCGQTFDTNPSDTARRHRTDSCTRTPRPDLGILRKEMMFIRSCQTKEEADDIFLIFPKVIITVRVSVS